MLRPEPPAILLESSDLSDLGIRLTPAPEVWEWLQAEILIGTGSIHNEDHAHLLDADIRIMWASSTSEAIDASVREIIIEVGSSLIRMSPVGNPEIWAQNAVASEYNKAVDEHNTALRSDPANLTKGGRLKKGRKLNDGMDIVAPKGYVGGRFRANWHVSLGVVENVTFDEVDPSGAETTAALVAAMSDFTAGQMAYIINNLPYAIPLEFGHSTQAPTGMVRVTVARFQQIVMEAIRNNQV